jgi:ribose 5-phosphate isomerase B
MALRIAIGSDHAGYTLKMEIVDLLEALGHEATDFGTDSLDSCDYPDYVKTVAEAVASGLYNKGIFICGTGIGPAMAANKIKGIRAALCHDTFSAKQSREHNDANMLCFGARVIGPGLAAEVVRAWLDTGFPGDERHKRRIGKIMDLEA